jgi:geranylgeranyl reductase family protein
VVVGAGPAGLTVARLLAAERFSVLVLEEHAEIGTPVHCTGVLGLEAFAEFDLPRETITTITRNARFHGRHGRSIRVDGGEVAAAVVDRGRFDRALADEAETAGATLLRGARVLAIDVNPRVTARVEVGGAVHTVTGRVCVLACGAQYRFNRQLGLGIPRAYLQSAQLEMPFPRVDDVEIDLDRSLAPRGFAWIVPFERSGATMARVGLMASDAAATRFKAYTQRLGERHGADAVAGQPRLKVLPLAPATRPAADRVAAVGDAAGLAKPTTGGGIYYRLMSGRFAA